MRKDNVDNNNSLHTMRETYIQTCQNHYKIKNKSNTRNNEQPRNNITYQSVVQ